MSINNLMHMGAFLVPLMYAYCMIMCFQEENQMNTMDILIIHAMTSNMIATLL